MIFINGRGLTIAAAILLSCFTGGTCRGESDSQSVRIAPPPAGRLYHGVFPGGITGEENDITPNNVDVYEKHVGKKVAWVYLSHNWFAGRKFPLETANWIRERGAVPFIRLMLRSTTEEGRREKLYTLQHIIDGKFDDDLKRWGQSAKQFGSPLLVEYGTECNGEWFPWNGRWHGGGKTKKYGNPHKPDGPERFVDAFRHIVMTIRAEGADNITWVFHPDTHDWPNKKWNRFENYYPGDDVVDWIGVSAYGPQTPMDSECESFRQMMDSTYNRLEKLAPNKPVIALEFGCTKNSPAAKPHEWAGAALDDIFSNRWPRIIGFSWWNERWENDDNPKHNTTMCVEDIPKLSETFKKIFRKNSAKIVERPIY